MPLDTPDIEKALHFMPPELSAKGRARVWLEMAQLRVSRCYFGDAYPLALSYLASHMGTLEDRGDGGEVGSVTSKSEGNISIGYSAAGGGTNDDLLQTIYGRAYLELLHSKRPVPGITGSFASGYPLHGGCRGDRI